MAGRPEKRGFTGLFKCSFNSPSIVQRLAPNEDQHNRKMRVNLEELWLEADFSGHGDSGIYLKNLLSQGRKAKLNYQPSDEMKLPPWYCPEKYKKAQQFYRENRHSVLFSNLIGLIFVLAVESILNVLIYTNKSSTSKTAYKRYAETLFLVTNFYGSLPEGNSRCWRSIARVRRLHRYSSDKLEGNGKGFINQRDMAITQFGLMGHLVGVPEKLGLTMKSDQLEGLVHMWRVVGFMLGIEDQFNLCADDYKTTKERIDLMMDFVVRPVLANTPPQFNPMFHSFIKGIKYLLSVIDSQSILLYTLNISSVPGSFLNLKEKDQQYRILIDFPEFYPRDILEKFHGIDISEHFTKMSRKRRFKLKAMLYIHQVLFHGNPLWKIIFNNLLRLKLLQIKYLPLKAVWDFGFSHGFIRVNC